MIADKKATALLEHTVKLKELHDKWQAQKHQAEVINAIFGKRKIKRVFIRGGRKSAKTETFLYLMNRVAGTGNNKVCSIIGPSYKQQKKIVWKNNRLVDFAPKSWGGDPAKSETTITFPNRSFMEVDGSDNAESHRGEEQDLLILDELKDHEQDSYEAMYPNLSARDGILVVGGSPPRSKRNLYYRLEQQALEDPRWLVVHWRCWMNDRISRRWLEEEKEAYYRRGDGYLWESEYEANYVFGGKDAVFSVFDVEKHTMDFDAMRAILEPDKHKLDYFIISDPGNRVCHATLFIAFDKTNNHVWVLDEIYETEQANTATIYMFPRIMAKAAELFPEGVVPWYVYDEAALWYYTEVTAQFPESPPMTPTNKAIRDKETGMGTIKTCMANGKYHQSHRCINLQEEILSYYTDESGKYPKVDDHAIDGLRYFFDFVGYSYDMQVVETLNRKKIITPDEFMQERKRKNAWADTEETELEDLLWN